MRTLFVLLALAAIGCTVNPPDLPVGCTKDTDCREPRVCEAGSCVDKGTPSYTPTDAGADSSFKFNCGAIVKDCNCENTYASPGLVEPENACQSGYKRYDICDMCPGGGYAWYTACVCQ